MKPLNRRKFIRNSIKTASGLSIASAVGCQSHDQQELLTKSNNISRPLELIQREDIRITDIKVTPMSYVPEDGSYLWEVNKYVVWKTDSALVEVFTDQGILGFAEGTPYSNPMEINRFTDQHITPVMKGKNPFDADYLTSGGPWREYLPRAAWAGINNALWDIIGKAKGKPVYQLLATDCEAKNIMYIYASGGVTTNGMRMERLN